MNTTRETIRLILTTTMANREVGRITGLSYNTVRRYRRVLKQKQIDHASLDALDDAALERLVCTVRAFASDKRMPDWAAIHEQLQQPHVTLLLLWEEYRLVDPDTGYSYSQFTYYYRKFVGKLQLSMRQSHPPGECGFVDFAGSTIPWICRETNEERQAQIFVGVLGCSNYSFAYAVPSQSVPYWIDLHERMLQFFGGVPKIIVPDNLKSAVIRAGTQPELNRTYLEMAQHYGTIIVPARPKHPRDKAKVEAAVLFISRYIIARLRNQKFFSIEEINVAISHWLTKFNERPFRQLPGNRRTRFEQFDAPKLKPLPATPFEYAEWVGPHKVNNDYHVNVRGHFYSVPHELVHSSVEVRITTRTVEILFQGRRVASHARSEVIGGHTTLPAHQPASHRHYAEQDIAHYLEWAETVGQAAVAVVRHQFANQAHALLAQRACSTLRRLAKDYSPERLERACQRAQAIGSMTLKSIRSILQSKINVNNVSVPVAASHASHENIRGASYYSVGGR